MTRFRIMDADALRHDVVLHENSTSAPDYLVVRFYKPLPNSVRARSHFTALHSPTLCTTISFVGAGPECAHVHQRDG